MGSIEYDLACVIIRIEQINIQKEPEHWLWERVMSCDIPRLREHLSETTLENLDDVLDDIREAKDGRKEKEPRDEQGTAAGG